jgi:TetR/AcrR family transcriptional repressor of nem operon
MRTKSGEKEQLRKEILKDSVKTFKKYGQAGAPVDQIMKRAGLTSGALYSHFKGKDDLFHEATIFDLDNLIEKYQSIISEKKEAGLKMIVDDYMTLKHVEHPEIGCLFSSLSADIHRAPAKKKADYESRYLAVMDIFASGIAKGTRTEKMKTAQLIYSLMVGTVATARSLATDEVMEEILSLGRSQIYALLK